MHILKDIPIQQKIILIVMIICTTVLLAAYTVFIYSQWQTRHHLLKETISTLTRVVGINSSASLAFFDQLTGDEILSVLRTEKEVVSAELFSKDGELFASYQSEITVPNGFFYQIIDNSLRKFQSVLFQEEHDGSEQISYGTGYMDISQKIKEGSRLVGTIHIRVSLRSIYKALIQQMALMAGLVFIMLSIAYLLARQLQKLISQPILHLSHVMHQVTKSNNYTLRATAEGSDELGDLIIGFNQMLEKIQKHDEHLSQAVQNQRLARKEADEAKEVAELANHSKSEFLANMSHELRTPMHAILSFSNFGIKKLDKVPLEKLGNYFSRVHESGNRLMCLLNDLLDLAKLEAGRMEMNFIESDLSLSLDTCINEQEACLLDKGVELITTPECDTKGVFDPARIGQVITNLLSNSIKFTPKGKRIFVSIIADSLSNQTENGDNLEYPALRMIVRDEGIGIPEDEFENVFDKFIQSSKTKTGAGGTGLGLAICKEIIDGHKGRIWVESSPKDGAVFSFVIPVNQTDFSA